MELGTLAQMHDAEGSVEVSRDVRKDIWQAKTGRLDFAINTGHDVTKLAQAGGLC